MIHNHWTIVAYKKRIPIETGGTMRDEFVEISLDADTEDEAMKLAKETIKRPFYDVVKVFCCTQEHGSQSLHDEALVLQLEMQKQMLKKLT